MLSEQGGYLGRFQLGQRVRLHLWTLDPSRVPTAPDRLPLCRVYDAAGSVVASAYMSVSDKFGVTGLFVAKLYLTFGYEPGHFNVAYSYTVGGHPIISGDSFEIIDGGDVSGTVISLGSFRHPESDFVLAHLNSRRIVQGRNPHV
jgi:hypothetical protein